MNDWEPDKQTAEPEVEAPPERYPFWGYRDMVLFLGASLPALITAALVVRTLFMSFSWPGQGQAPELLAVQFLAYALWFVVLFMILRLKYGRPFWGSLGWVRPAGGISRYAGWGVVLAFGVALAGVLLRTPDLDMPIKRLLTDPLSIVLLGVAASTVGPLCEELAFRGFFLPLLVRSLGPVGGILLTSAPFALLHGQQYGWSWRHLLLIGLASVAFGWVRYRTGSTLAATVMHATYNLTIFTAFVLQRRDLPIT